MIGASDWRILRRHLLPHLVPTLLVWAPIAVATNILLEVGLSFIGVGVQPSTPTWGSLLAHGVGNGLLAAELRPRPDARGRRSSRRPRSSITVLSLNQVSEGIRRAIEPWGAAMRRVVAFVARRLAAAIVHAADAGGDHVRRVLGAPVHARRRSSIRRSQHLTQYQLHATRTTCWGSTGRSSCSTATTWRHLAHGDFGHSGPARTEPTTCSDSPDRGRTVSVGPAQRSRSSSAGRSSCSARRPARGDCGQPDRLARPTDDLDRRAVGCAPTRWSLGSVLQKWLRIDLHAPVAATARSSSIATARYPPRSQAAAGRPTGRGICAAVVHVRAALPRALHAHDPGQCCRDDARGLRAHRTREGRGERRVMRRHVLPNARCGS